MNYKISVEVPLMLCYFSFLLIGNLAVNLMTYKVCYNILHYPEYNCSRLGRYTDNDTQALEKIVQPQAGLMTSVTEMVPSTIPVFLALFIGSWSDKYGRKPVLMFVLCCRTIGLGLNAIMLLFPEINPWLLMLTSIPTMLTGGITTFFTVTLAYLNDLSTPENRGLRMVVFDVVQILAALLGGLSSSYVLYATSYAAVYGIGCALIAISTIYTYFLIPESLKNASNEKPSLSNIFTWANISDLFKIAGKKRKYNKRSIILLVIFALVILTFVNSGETNVKTQYLRSVLGWTLTKKNVFGAWSSVVGIIATITITFFMHKKLKVGESVLTIMGLISFIGTNILYATATDDSYIYGSVPVGLFMGVASPMLRTILTKLIVPEEMGKMFSFLMVINSFCLLGSSLTYQEIYNKTLETHPATFNYVSIGLNTIAIAAVIIVAILESRVPLEGRNIAENLETTSTEKQTEK